MTDERLELLSAYLDGELDTAEVRRVERLLSEDREAAAWLADQRRIAGVLGGSGQVEVPPSFAGDVIKRLRADGALPVSSQASSQPSDQTSDQAPPEGRVLAMGRSRFGPGLIAAGLMAAVGLMALVLTMLENRATTDESGEVWAERAQAPSPADEVPAAALELAEGGLAMTFSASGDDAFEGVDDRTSLLLRPIEELDPTSQKLNIPAAQLSTFQSVVTAASQNQIFVAGSDSMNWVSDTLQAVQSADALRNLSVRAGVTTFSQVQLAQGEALRKVATDLDLFDAPPEEKKRIESAEKKADGSAPPAAEAVTGSAAESAEANAAADKDDTEEVIVLELYEDELETLIEHLEKLQSHQGRSLQAVAGQFDSTLQSLLQSRVVGQQAPPFSEIDISRFREIAKSGDDQAASRSAAETASPKPDQSPQDRVKDSVAELERGNAKRERRDVERTGEDAKRAGREVEREVEREEEDETEGAATPSETRAQRPNANPKESPASRTNATPKPSDTAEPITGASGAGPAKNYDKSRDAKNDDAVRQKDAGEPQGEGRRRVRILLRRIPTD